MAFVDTCDNDLLAGMVRDIATRFPDLESRSARLSPIFGLIVPDGEDISWIDQAEVTPCAFKYWATLFAL